MKHQKRALRLTYELEVLDGAVEAAWLLAEQLRIRQFAEDSHLKLAPRAIASVLALVSVRVREVEAVLRGDRAVESLLAPHNDASGQEDESGHDLLRVGGPPKRKQ